MILRELRLTVIERLRGIGNGPTTVDKSIDSGLDSDREVGGGRVIVGGKTRMDESQQNGRIETRRICLQLGGGKVTPGINDRTESARPERRVGQEADVVLTLRTSKR